MRPSTPIAICCTMLIVVVRASKGFAPLSKWKLHSVFAESYEAFMTLNFADQGSR